MNGNQSQRGGTNCPTMVLLPKKSFVGCEVMILKMIEYE